MQNKVKVTVTVEQDKLNDFLIFLGEAELSWSVIKPVPLPPSSKFAEVVYRLLAEGRTVRDISDVIGIGKTTVSKIGRNPEKYGLDFPPIGKNLH